MILLDTSVLIKWISAPKQLSKKAIQTIEEVVKREELLVSSISVWEICLLVKKGRLEFFIDNERWLEKIESLPFVRFIPIDNKIAAYSVNLPDFEHKDPADRIIIATALQLGANLVTSDQKILDYSKVRTVW